MARFMVTTGDMARDLRRACAEAKGRYLVLDCYDSIEVLYDGNDIAMARKARRERIQDTDGEACVRFLIRSDD